MSFIKEFGHLKIGLETIQSATRNFGDNNCIGKGGFGKVYKGELNHFEGRSMVAVKRLDRTLGQGDLEFWKEVMMLSRYRHTNLVSLLGFCDENNEKILVYEYVSHGSLDYYLSSNDLTWIKRLKICIGVACGLEYLHDPEGRHQRVLHRDIKSSNILLDENWEAKISDLGLSKIGPANQEYTFLITNAVGTYGYCDPLYMETFVLTKESDVYSFGVVLFEVLCGRLCIGSYNDGHRFLVQLARQSYEDDKMNEIIHDGLKDHINLSSLKTFTTIAYQCLKRDREERPTMTKIVKQLRIAFELQEGLEESKQVIFEHEEILNLADTPKENFEESKEPVDHHDEISNMEDHTKIIRYEELEELRMISTGAYTTVYKGLWMGSEVSIKRIKGTCSATEKKRLSTELRQEADVLSRLNHPNVVAFYGAVRDGRWGTLANVTEFFCDGSLSDFLLRNNRRGLYSRQRLIIAMGAAAGMEYVHSNNIVHFNLSSFSLLLNVKDSSRPVCKVAGFALSKMKDKSSMTTLREVVNNRGNLCWMAPELLDDEKKGKVSEKVDVFSFGIVLWEIVTNEKPYAGIDEEEIRSGVVNNTLRPVVPSDCDRELGSLMVQCWDHDPKSRPSFTKIVKQLHAISAAQPGPM